jgi:outer membrane protein assembly factor BamB
LVGLHAGERVQTGLRRLRSSLPIYRQALGQYVDELVLCKRILAEREIEEAYDLCRVQAVKYLTNARLDDAESYYRALEQMVARTKEDPELAPIRERVEARRYMEFVKEKLSVIQDIREGLANAKSAEAAGDIQRAVRIYMTLAERYWLIRLEDIIQMPMQVRTVPEGVDVFLGDECVGRTPCVVHYLWAKQQTLGLEGLGFAPERRLIGTQKVEPLATLEVDMSPRRRWTVPIDENVIRAPMADDGDLLVVERNGRLTRLAGSDGSARWARHVRTLEGTRARPIRMEQEVALVFLDGRLVFFDPTTGSPKHEDRVGRPAGDPACVGDTLLIPTLDGHVVGYRGQRTVFEKDVGDRPTAGFVLGHDQAWFGLSSGEIARVNRVGEVQRTMLPGRATDVLDIAVYGAGVLATKSDGVLAALEPDGSVRWSQKDLGDLEGHPAVAGEVVAVADRRGHVLFFGLKDGHPLGQVTLGEATVGGLLATESGNLIALLRDGTLWVHAVKTGTDRVRVNLRGEVRIPPVLVGRDLLAVPADGGQITLVELPPPSRE